MPQITSKEMYLSQRGLNIYTKVLGEGEPLVFLHGGPGGEHQYFLPHLEELSQNFQLIFYDQRGCGKSEKLSDKTYMMEGEVETLEALRETFKIQKLNLIGESWGTMLSLQYAVKYPEKVNKIFMAAAVGATIEGFLRFEKELLNRLTTDEKRKLDDLTIDLENGKGDIKEIFKIIDPYYVCSAGALSRRTPTKSSREVNEIMGKDIIDHYDVSQQTDKLKNIPILVAQGDHDIITPILLKDLLLKFIPHAKLRVIENCGHWSVIEQPKLLKKLIKDFFGVEIN